MEPLSSPTAIGPVLRPAPALRGELSLILRQGRVVVAEVLEARGAGSLVLSIAGQRVSAQSPVDLEPRSAFLALVESGPEGFVLRMLPEDRPEDARLLDALRAVAALDVPQGRLFTELAQELRAALATATGVEREVATRLLDALEAHVVRPDGDGARLAQSLRGSGLFLEARLARGEPVVADLKALLLCAREELTEGRARSGVERALRGFEAEQLLDVARTRSGDPLHASLPVPDGAGLTSLHLSIDPDRRRDSDAHDGEGECPVSRRIQLAVHFTRLGAVRADLRLVDGVLGIRFTAANLETADRLSADLSRLGTELSIEGRAPQIVVAHEPEGDPAADIDLSDIRFLIEHPLVDFEG